ncbi:xyloglucanase precursor [mine drainage metagenome]|uniref:Xyloglucanase n=1 Tax=mine drainage metagenome TaxID=410659 RepID=A0A1J5T3F9_9ZZZZ
MKHSGLIGLLFVSVLSTTGLLSACGGAGSGSISPAGTGGSSGSSTPQGSVAPSTGWANIKMGGGGYVPGVIYHPTATNLRYARTDMDGVYRWDNGISQWTALTDGFGRPDGGNEGAESLAVDPTDASKVYMTTSMAVSYGNGRFYYSSNQGNTWNYVSLPFPVGSNNQGRAIGERLAVDPNLPSTMFYASRTAGLWKSTDRGLTWHQTLLSSYVMTTTDMTNSNGGSPVGIEFVVFDTTVPTTGFSPTGSATQTIYVGVAPDYKGLAGLASYLYKSTDGGTTWTAITIPAAVTSATTGTPAVPVLPYIPHMVRAADGMFYVPFASSSGPGSGAPSWLYKFDGTAWTKLISSSDVPTTYYGGIGGLSVYGSGPTTKIAFGVSGTWGDATWVQIAMASADDGQTWHEIGRSGDSNGSHNYHDATGTTGAASPSYWGWVDDLKIDPFNPDHVSYVVGGGIWSTSNAFSSATPSWVFDVNGIEEMVNLAMMAPPPGASYLLASGQGDTGIYVNTSLTVAPTRSPNLGATPLLGGGNGTGIDMAWNNPAYIAAVGTFTTSKGVYSTDSGATWTNFPTLPPTASASGDQSRVVVTADGSNVIWSVAGQAPYYTTNNGSTWTATNLPAPASGGSYHVAADRKNPLKVYAYDHGGNWWGGNPPGKFYRSADGGHTFTISSQTWGNNGFSVTDLAVNPFAEGDVWLADANNLWHSVDSGITWTKLTAMATVGPEFTNVHGAIKVALGVPAAGSTYSAAVYLVGTIKGKDGVYRSDDQGITWTRIDDDNHRYGGVSGIVADAKVYGRVFLAGRGMNYNY